MNTFHIMLIILVSVFIALLIPSCKKADPPLYEVGQYVEQNLTGNKCQIIRVIPASIPWYKVRIFTGHLETPSHLIGSGGKVNMSNYTTGTLYEYELSPWEDD